MLSNLLKDRVLLIQKVIVQGPLGGTTTYVPVQWKYAQVKPLSVYARAQYQQAGHSEVTHEVTFRDEVTISLGNYRIKHGPRTYEPVEPAKIVDGNTIIAVKEI